MFARGGRFLPEKSSSVPGPNAYDVQDPEYGLYKHGAFPEKTDRFSKQKAAEGPGPGSSSPDTRTTKHASRTMKPSSDRTAALQRKVEELERQLQEYKRTHHADAERLRFELNRSQKTNMEQNERIDKLKKQNEALEARTQELKKLSDKDKSEVKELRTKLRVSEYERTQLSSKQGEVGEMKKALHALDAKRRDELRDRDRKIVELEKALSGEKKRRDALEARLVEVNGKRDTEVQAAKDAAQAMEAELHEAKADAQHAKASLNGIRTRSADIEEAFLAQLEQHKDMLSRIADEYGRLASTTVSRHEHSRLKRDLAASQLRVVRLERKLANSEAQVIEVANLVRQTKDENKFLERSFWEAEQEAAFYSAVVKDLTSELVSRPGTNDDFEEVQDAVGKGLRDAERDKQRAVASLDSQLSKLHDLQAQQLFLHSTVLLKRLDEKDSHIESQSSQLSIADSKQTQLLGELVASQEKDAITQRQLRETTTSLAEARGQVTTLKRQFEETKASTKSEMARLERVVSQEKEATQRLASTVQQSHQAEEALREEVDLLTSELTEAERYVEAYTNMVDEVGILVRRNALAEEEAERLSKFNAEILGHHNPSQRILYVDRIRRELHDMKQKLIVSTREKDAVLEDNDELRYELAMYKSVGIPAESRPRTTVTRVTRIPLGSQNQNIMSTHLPPVSSKKSGPIVESPTSLEYKEGDLTLEDIS